MKIIKKTINTDAYYFKHLEIINPFLPIPLTNKETEVLASFMALSGDLVESSRFNSEARAIVRKRLKLTMGGLSNYIRILSDKGYLYDEGTIIKIRQYLFPNPKSQGYQFILNEQV